MRARIIVKGKVQGVGFRNFVRVTAKYSNLRGLVRNLSDGSVEIFADGSEENIAKMVNIIKTNIGITVPARIDNVDLYHEGSDNFRPAWKDYMDKFSIDRKSSD
ncbi:MAG: acylphosphatase [Candidatus Micrarchaeota archaeon]|nr:acylphosphatase [Candidatus Micrarchaeota archaeon]